MPTTIAVTGAAGHLGAALCRRLLIAGFRVRALIRTSAIALQNLELELVKGDLEEKDTLDRLCKGVDTVYHLAGLISIGSASIQDLWHTNVDGTASVLTACQRNGVRRLVHFSSIHAYSAVPKNQVFDETAPSAWEYPYERSKAAAQALVLAANGDLGLETLCLNPTAVLGPWDFRPSLQGQMVLDLMQGRLPILTPGGFDWVDNRDVAQAALSAHQLGQPGEAYILAGRYATMLEIANLIGKAADRRAPKYAVPFALLRGISPLLKIWSHWAGKEPLFTIESLSHVERGHPQVSSAKAARELNYLPRPLEETIGDTCTWLNEHYLSKSPSNTRKQNKSAE